MVIISSPVDELAGHARAPPHLPPASTPEAPHNVNPPPPASVTNPAFLFDGEAALQALADTMDRSSCYPPHASTAAFFSQSAAMVDQSYYYYSQTPETAPPLQTQPAMLDPSYYYSSHQTQGGFPSFSAATDFASQLPTIWQMQSAGMQPPSSSAYSQGTTGASASSAEAGGALSGPTPTPAQEVAPKPAPRRRGRPRKLTAAIAVSKPAAASKPKRATSAPTKRAALQQQIASVTETSTIMPVHQVQAQQPDQAAAGAVAMAPSEPDRTAPPAMSNPGALLHLQEHGVVAVSPSEPDRTAPPATPNPEALLHLQEHQGQLQSSGSNSPRAEDPEVMGPYADPSPPGVRFLPTDEELIFYLRRRYAGLKMPVDFFKDFDVYHAHPEDIRAACGEAVDGCWYAFSPRVRKYKKGKRPRRSVFSACGAGGQVGFWKSNSKLKDIRAGGKDGAVIGRVTALTFLLGRQRQHRGEPMPKNQPTPWKMREYSIKETQHEPDGSDMLLNQWVVCQLFYKEAPRHRAAQIAGEEDESGEDDDDDEDDDGASEGGEEGAQLVPAADQATRESDQPDLCVDDYLMMDEKDCNILRRPASIYKRLSCRY